MSSRTLPVSVNPRVMKWARESAGVSLEAVAARVGTSVETAARWESESAGRQPTLRALENLATFFKRPLATFFLPEPTEEPPPPADFRVLPGQESASLSPRTRLAIREARRLRNLAIELMAQVEGKVEVKLGKTRLHAHPEAVAQEERERIGVTLEEQFGWRNPYAALNGWMRALERLKVLVFQMRMPVGEARGFSIGDGSLPAIVVNASDAVRARIFTLFHEYAHLLLGTEGVCRPEECPVSGGHDVERFCNHFAGALLVPKEALMSVLPGASVAPSSEVTDEELEHVAARFKTSRQVIWRRMRLADLVSARKYQGKLKAWEEETPVKRKRSGFAVAPAKRCVRERGRLFTSLVLEAKERDLITYSDVADYLSLRLKHLPKLHTLLEKANG